MDIITSIVAEFSELIRDVNMVLEWQIKLSVIHLKDIYLQTSQWFFQITLN